LRMLWMRNEQFGALLIQLQSIELSVRFQVLTAASMIFRIVFWDVQGRRQYAPLKRRSTIILHGSTSQKTILNMILN
jgi:hypothetical protein